MLNDLMKELGELDPEEKLEWLVEFAQELPDVSAEKRADPLRETCRVQGCQTAVYLWVSVKEGRIHLEADVPRQSPLVRGLVALVVRGLEGASIQDGLDLPDDMVARLGLSSVLGMTRQKGFREVIARIKRVLRPSD